MALRIDHARINAAIARAEETTSGEITCVIKARALEYPETPLVWAAAVALIAPLVLFSLGLLPHQWMAPLLGLGGWYATGVTGDFTIPEAIISYALLQLVLFAAVYAVIAFTPLRLALTPKAIKHRRAHAKAQEQFYARGLHLTAGHTGVMIFCALEERFVEVIADEGIYGKIDKDFWDATVAALVGHIRSGDLTTGFEQSIAACGAALAGHFPPGASNPNELPDVLIEI